MSKNIGLDKTNEGKNITRMFTQLALLPPILIPEAYLSLLEAGPDTEEYVKFQNYFSTQLLQIVTYEQLSCYGEKIRTTNGVAGYHRRLNSKIPPKPALYHFLQLLKKEAEIQERKLSFSLYSQGKRRSEDF